VKASSDRMDAFPSGGKKWKHPGREMLSRPARGSTRQEALIGIERFLNEFPVDSLTSAAYPR
jgi:hypothetical protein